MSKHPGLPGLQPLPWPRPLTADLALLRNCVRARLSAVGEVFTCLFAARGFDLRAVLRSGADDAEVAAVLGRLWGLREDRASELRAAEGLTGPRVEMSYIGG